MDIWGLTWSIRTSNKYLTDLVLILQSRPTYWSNSGRLSFVSQSLKICKFSSSHARKVDYSTWGKTADPVTYLLSPLFELVEDHRPPCPSHATIKLWPHRRSCWCVLTCCYRRYAAGGRVSLCSLTFCYYLPSASIPFCTDCMVSALHVSLAFSVSAWIMFELDIDWVWCVRRLAVSVVQYFPVRWVALHAFAFKASTFRSKKIHILYHILYGWTSSLRDSTISRLVWHLSRHTSIYCRFRVTALHFRVAWSGLLFFSL